VVPGPNIPGKADRVLLYFGGLVVYRAKLEEVVANGYEGFVLRRELAGAGSRAG